MYSESSRGWEKCRCRCGKEVSYESVNTKIGEKKIQKYTEPATQDINALVDGGYVAIQDLVKKLNSGAGIKVV